MLNSSALRLSIIVGTVLQLVMVVAGHFIPIVAQGFAIGGMSISAIAGLLYARHRSGAWKWQILGAAIAGGVCALIGIVVSFWLGDVPAVILIIGAASSAVTGAMGGVFGQVTAHRR
jgi:hypothetical protein